MFRIILQHSSDLSDCASDAVVGIEEDAFAPDLRDDHVAGDDLVPVVEQQNQDFQRDPFQLQLMTSMV